MIVRMEQYLYHLCKLKQRFIIMITKCQINYCDSSIQIGLQNMSEITHHINVTWILSQNNQKQKITPVNTYSEFEQILSTYLTPENNAFLKEGQCYLRIEKAYGKIKDKFSHIHQLKDEQQKSVCIQLFLKPEIEKKEKLKKLKEDIEKANREITQKMKAEIGLGYYYSLKMQKKKSEMVKDNDVKNIKVYLLISEPLVKKNHAQDNLNQKKSQLSQKYIQASQQRNDQYSGIPKQQIKIDEHIQAIKDAHEGKNYGVNLFIERVFVSWSKIKALVERIKHPKREEEKNIHLNIIQIYTELYEENSKLFVSLEDDKVIGLEDKSVTLNSLIAKLNEIGEKLYCIVLVGPKMRRLGLLRIEKKQQMQKKQLENKKREQKEKEKELKKEKQKEKNLQNNDKNLQVQLLMVPQTISFRKQRSFTENIQRSNLPVSKQWYEETKIPIIAVSVFDPQKDNFLKKHFLLEFYTNIFKRNPISKSFQNTVNQIGKQIEKQLWSNINQSLPNCCCVHNNNSANWNNIVKLIGYPTAHKLFRHNDGSIYKDEFEKNEQIRKEIYKFIFNKEPEKQTEKNNIFNCYTNKDLHFTEKKNKRQKLDLQIFNASVKNFEQSQLLKNEKKYWQAGQFIKQQNIERNKNSRYRPLTLFQIIQKIMVSKELNILVVTGGAKSGKSLFIEMAQNYIKNRESKIKFQGFQDWRKKFHIKKYKEQICEKKKKCIDKKLVLNLQKINYEIKEDFQNFSKELNQIEEIKNENIVLLVSIGDSQEIKLKQFGTVYQIAKIPHYLMKYLILKHQSTLFCKKQQVIDYIEIIESIKKEESSFTNEIYFSYLCNDLKTTDKLLKNKMNKAQRHKFIKDQIERYKNKTSIILHEMHSQRIQLWETIGFICSFKEGFMLTDFNKDLAFKNHNFLQQLIKNQQLKGSNDSKVRLFRINFFENSQQNYKLQNSYLIHSESKCFEYFKKHSSYFFPRKCRYFLQFYHLFFIFLKRNSGTKLTEHCQRIIDELGIFIFNFDQKFKQMETQNNRMSQLRENPEKQLKKMTPEQRSYLLERNLYLLIQFLKEVNDKDGKELKKMEKELVEVSRIILLVSICRKSEDELVCCLKDELNYEIVRFLEANQFLIQSQYKDEVIILFYQISALVGYQLKIKVQADSIVRMLDNLLVYEMSKIEIERAKRLIEQNRNCRDHQVERIVEEIKRAEDAIKTNLEEGNLSDLQSQNHHECLLDLLVEKVVLFHSTEGNNFEAKSLKGQFDELIQRVSEKTRNAPTIKICEAYLKVKLNIHSNKDLDEKKLLSKYFPEKMIDIYQFAREKINPKALFQSNNIALFMKAGCLKVGNDDYNYVRIDNIINRFLGNTMGFKSLNVLFLNLSHKNFEMVSEQSPQILYFVLSVDCYEDKSKQLQVILEGSNLEGKQMRKEEFINLIKKIKFKFLILFGSKSTELASEIEAKLHEEKKERAFVIISLTLNKRYDLSTYPFLDEGQTPDVANIADSFTRVEYGQRAMQMTICCIIYLLAKERHSKEVTKQQISQIVEKSTKISQKVVDDWCKKTLGKFAPKIFSRVHFKEGLKMQFPLVGQGKIRNITCDITAIRKNFQDDKYYQNIGHTTQISQIFLKLSSNKIGSIIEISGNHNSGKSQILKQIGWYCFTRRIFELGVMRFDVAELIKNQTLSTLKLLLNQQINFEGNKALLILLDNLQKDYMTSSENADVFAEFFNSIILKKKPVSVVYTIRSDYLMDQTHKITNQILKGFLEQHQQPIFPISLNKLQNVDKVCIMLINIRSPENVDYNEVIKLNFESIFNLEIKKSPSKSLSPSISIETQKKTKVTLKHNKITRRVSEQSSLLKSPPSFLINRIKSTYGPLREMYETIQQQPVQDCTPSYPKDKRVSLQAELESDLNEVLQKCEQYMRKKLKIQIKEDLSLNEQNKKNYTFLQKQRQKKNYLTFDVQNITRLLTQLDGIQVLIHNQSYFPFIRD